jgi:RimJ/RimL family protein N-acetyltransferase
MAGSGPVAHFFLWKAGGNPHSWQYRLQVPELGVAVADECQARGLGSLAVRILQAVAGDLGADAIELTTAMTNKGGWTTYRRCGFEYVGMIRIPLGVDVTAALAGEVHASRFREERQMVYVLRKDRREQVLDYLRLKRESAVA